MKVEKFGYSKRIRGCMFMVLFSLLITLVASNIEAAESDVSKEMKEAIAAIGEYTVEQKDAAVEKAKEMMDKLDERIHDLEGKLESGLGKSKDASREKYEKTLKALHKQRNTLSEWYDNMKNSSKDGWKEVKEGFSNTYNALVESWRKADEEAGEER